MLWHSNAIMRKKFVENFSFLLLSNLLIKPVWIFGIDRKIQLIAGAEEYGNYFAAMNFSFIFSIILDLGINNFVNRAISRTPNRAGSFLGNLIKIKAVLGISYLLITVAFAWFSGLSEPMIGFVLFLGLNQLLLSFVLHFRAYIAALHFFKVDSIISITDKALAILFVVAVWFFFHSVTSLQTIYYFIFSQTAALLLTALAAFYFLGTKVYYKTEQWSFKFIRVILLQSFPFALLVLQMTIYGRIDGILLHRILPNNIEETGIYASGFRLLDAATQFGYLSATILLPLFAKSFKNRSDLKPLVGLSSILMLMASSFLAVCCYFWKSEIVLVLYHTTDIRYAEVLSILMFTFIPISTIYVFGTLLTAKGDLKVLNTIALLGIILSISLNLVLIPKNGAVGAAKAALITQLVVALAHIAAAYKPLFMENARSKVSE
jgi:O-antigen/teichoic acid export membrane protein